MTRRILTLLTVVATAATLSARGDEKLGAGVTLTEATPIAALYEKPQDYVGKTIRIDGIVTGVCSEMGCWMALGDDEKGTRTVRFKVDHGVAIVFPIKAKGMKASAQGVFEKHRRRRRARSRVRGQVGQRVRQDLADQGHRRGAEVSSSRLWLRALEPRA